LQKFEDMDILYGHLSFQKVMYYRYTSRVSDRVFENVSALRRISLPLENRKQEMKSYCCDQLIEKDFISILEGYIHK